MSFDEKYAEWKKKQKDQDTQEGVDDRFESRYNEWKFRTYGEDIVNDLNQRINAWMTGVDTTISSHNDRYKAGNAVYRPDANDWYERVKSLYNTTRSSAESIKADFDRYGKYLNKDWTESVYSAIDGNLASFEKVLNASIEDRNFMSNFKDEDDFNINFGYEQKYKGKTFDEIKSASAKATGTEADWLKAYSENYGYKDDAYYATYTKSVDDRLTEIDAKIKAAKAEGRTTTNANFDQKNVPSNVEYIRQDEIDALEEERTELLAQKKRTQNNREGFELGSVSDSDPEFQKYADIGAKVDNPDSIDDKMGWFAVGGWQPFGEEVNNPVTFALNNKDEYDKKSLEAVAGGGQPNPKAYGINHLVYEMNEDEIAVYNYYIGKGDKESADKYLESITGTLNNRLAQKIFKPMEGNTAGEIVFGAVVGLDQFSSGVNNFFSDEEDYIPASAIAQAGQMVREDLDDDGFDIMGNSLGQLAYDMVTTTANMAPSIAMGAIPVVGQGLGLASMGVSAAGNAYADAINSGYSKGQARAYSTLVGASEAGLSYLLGGISKLGGKVSGNIINKLTSGVNNAFARAAIKLGGNMVSEFTEEGLQEVLDPFFKNIAMNANNDWSDVEWGQVAYSGLLGALSAGILEGGGTIAGEVNTYKQGKDVIEKGETSNLVKFGKSLSADTVAYKLADKIDKGEVKTGAYTIGRLLHEAGADSLSETNIAEIEKSLVRKGVAPSHATTIATWLNKAVEGGHFTKSQRNALESNEVVSQTFKDIILNQNSTVNQRMFGAVENGYLTREQLEKLADNGTNAGALASAVLKSDATAEASVEETDSKKAPEAVDTTGFALLSDAEVKKRIADDPLFAVAYEQFVGGVNSEVQGAKAINPVAKSAAKEVDIDGRVSEDGKTTRISTGEVVTIDKNNPIAKTVKVNGNEVVYFNTNQGVVEVGDISYSNETEGLIYEGFTDLSPAIANAAIKAYDGKTPAQTFINGMREGILVYGKYNFQAVGKDISAESDFARLSAVDQKLALELGRKVAEIETTAADKKLKSAIRSAAKKVGKDSKGKPAKKGKVIFEKDVEAITDKQKVAVDFANKLAEVTGIQIIFYDSKVNPKHKLAGDDGASSGDTIWLDMSNSHEDAIIYTLSHEFVHFAKQWSHKKFKIFADFMVEQFADHDKPLEQLVRQKMGELKTNDWDYAFEEVVADACERMLLDSKAMEKLAKLKQKDPNIFKEFIQHIKDLITKIRSLYKDIDATNDYSEALQAMDGVMDRFYELFEDMAVDAVQNFQKANGKSNSSSEQIKYSEKDFPIDRAVQDIVRNSLATKNESKMRTLGVISPEENKGINRLSNRTNNDHYRGKYTNGKHLVSDAAIRHMMAEHSDFLRESLRAQLPLKETDIARTLSAIKDNRVPKSLDHSRTKRGNPSIITSFEINGYTLYAEEITRSLGKNLPSDLIGHTMYKAPTLATAAVSTTSVATLPRRQSEVLCNYYMPKSSNMSSDYFVSDKNGEPALLTFPENQGVPVSDLLNGGLIALSSDANNLSGNLSQGYVRCKKPFYITANNRVFSNSDTNVSERIKALKDQGYDCFIFDYETGDNHFVAVVNKSQIIEPKNMKGVSSQQTLGANNIKKQAKKKDNGKLDPRTVTEEEVRGLLEDVKCGKISGHTYFPIRINTPATLIYWANKRRGDVIDNNPIAIDAEKAYQAMARSGQDTEGRPHEMSVDDIISVIKGMSDPQYIVYQGGNGRYVEVIGYTSQSSRKAFAILEIGEDKNPVYMNGYDGGMYNILVTTFPPDSGKLKTLLENPKNEVIFDKKKDESQRSSSSSVPSLLNDSPFSKESISQHSNGVKRQQKKLSNRTLLANVLESAIDTSSQEGQNELAMLRKFQADVAKIEELEHRLAEVNAELKEISFGKGNRNVKHQRELAEEKTELVNRMNIYDRRLLKYEATKPIKDLLAREKEKIRKKYRAEGSERVRVALNRKNDSVRLKKEKESLQKLVLETTAWITKPKKGEVPCPDIIKEPLADFLAGIDTSSKKLLTKGVATQRDLKFAIAMDSLATAVEKIKNSQDPSKENSKGTIIDGYLDLPPDFVENIRAQAEAIKNYIKLASEGDSIINDMSADELKELSRIIKMLKKSIKEMQRLYTNYRFANAVALGKATVGYLNSLGAAKEESKFKDFAVWDNTVPYYAFKRFGEGGESIFESLMDAQDKLAFHADEILAFKEKNWTDKEVSSWSKEVQSISLENGEELKFTAADAMSIYCLSKRYQAVGHLLGGGVRVIGATKGGKKAADSVANLSPLDVEAICNTLTDRQKEVADKMQEFMTTVCADWGNEIWMKRFLTKNFTEKNYFPIESDPNTGDKKDPAAKQSDLFRLLNISATKPLADDANNKIVIRNVFDVFTAHTSDMARLNAYGMALLDYMKWLNYRERHVDSENGQVKLNGVRPSLEEAYGSAAEKYIVQLIKDINGTSDAAKDNAFSMKMIRSSKVAAVGANLRVAALQLTALPRAGIVLDTKSIILGMRKRPNIKKAKKYCGIALWKSFGFYDTNIGKSIESQIKGDTKISEKMVELSMKGAELGDSLVFGYLWNACEYEIAKTKQYKVGTEEFNQAVAKKLREVVYASQVVDSVLTKSQLMRSRSGLNQMVSAFMSEPTLTYNVLLDCKSQFDNEAKRTGSKKAAWKATKGIIVRGIASYVVTNILTALAEGFADAFRDDDDDPFGEKFIEAFWENFLKDINPLNKIPIFNDIVSFVESRLGYGYFSSGDSTTGYLDTVGKAYDAWVDIIKNGEDAERPLYYAIYNTAKAFSQFSGLPISNVMREVVTLWNNTAGTYDYNLKIRTYEPSDSTNAENLYQAIVSGDTKQQGKLESLWEDGTERQKDLKKVIGNHYKEGDIDLETASQSLEEYCGMSDFDAEKQVEKWEYTSQNGTTTGYSEYNDFYDAVESGKNLKAVVQEYTANGYDKKTLAGRITGHFKPLYKDMSNYERASLKGYLLNAYSVLGYERSKKSKDIDKWLKE